MNNKQIINTDKAPKAVGPYSQAVSVNKINQIVFLSGQIGLDVKNGNLISNDFSDQVKQSLKNMEAVIIASGGNLDNIIKLNLFLTDIKNFSIANELMESFIPKPFPARSTVEVSNLPKNAKFEIEAIIAI